jgi:hypothetical protein
MEDLWCKQIILVMISSDGFVLLIATKENSPTLLTPGSGVSYLQEGGLSGPVNQTG